MKNDLLTTTEIISRAQKMGIHCSMYTLKNWISSGELPSVKSGNRNLIYWPNFLRFVTGQESNESNSYTGLAER